ncbi:helix-turn-helix domain-containing protein [Marixanthomonas ophiurae]|uniref:Helix-turn-helix domain-containing protein n=1 Tax=Marixanthomonas ophiurae TaxID=387659 RepID=A0A3E1Q6R0_9FLAO|nr:helix-turn-helix domain-containing protein [Marixanthomonas ophiurae]RFN57809.1 helix-turn-helix domain-containing protein [Marixanthomonas ophiurae]
MKVFSYFFIVLIFSSAGIFGQEIAGDDFLFLKNLNTVYKDPSQAKRVADYLFKNANTQLEKAEALYLLSESKKRQGDYIESIEDLFKAKELVNPSKDHFLNSLLLISIAERCQTTGINDIAEEYLRKAARQINRIRQKEEFSIANAFLLYEQSNKSLSKDSITAAKQIAQSSEDNLEDLKAMVPALLIKNYVLQGNIHLYNKELDSAAGYFNKSQNLIVTSRMAGSSLEAETLKGIGEVQYATSNFERAKANFKKAMNIPVIEAPLRVTILRDLSNVYKAQDSMEAYQSYYRESSTLNASVLISERKLRNTIISHIEAEQEGAIQSDKRSYYIIVGIIAAVLLVCFIGYYFYSKKLDTEYKQFEKVIKQLENKEKLEAPKKVVQQENEGTKGVTIPKETENAILQRLEDFETTTKYTNSNMSLPLLAKQLETNTKYISEIIHTHKNKNFNTYINELRINHIIQLMKEDKKYLNYKVSYLAEESGFSSHSAFTVVFKSITGITPKQFITFLKKDDKVAS